MRIQLQLFGPVTSKLASSAYRQRYLPYQHYQDFPRQQRYNKPPGQSPVAHCKPTVEVTMHDHSCTCYCLYLHQLLLYISYVRLKPHFFLSHNTKLTRNLYQLHMADTIKSSTKINKKQSGFFILFKDLIRFYKNCCSSCERPAVLL